MVIMDMLVRIGATKRSRRIQTQPALEAEIPARSSGYN